MRNKITAVRIVFILLTAACMVAIFLFSCENADNSSDTSGRVARILLSIFRPGFKDLSSEEKAVIVSGMQHFVRKAAHFTAYMALCFCASIAVGKRPLFSSGTVGVLAFCFLYAGSDEIHQYFVPGRACMFRDVLLDTAGGLTGILISMLLWLIISKIIKKRTASSK